MPSKKVLIISGSIVGVVVVALAIALPLALINNDEDDDASPRAAVVQYEWTCEVGGFCQKKRITDGTRATAVGLNTCQLVCNPYAGIWPRPNSVQMSTKTLRQVDLSKMWVTARNYGTIQDLIQGATRRFTANAQLRASERDMRAGGSQVQVELVIENTSQRRLTLETDESYRLIVATDGDTINVQIEANNYFGARHGLETLSQILVYDNVQNQMNIPMNLIITDGPKYKFRGLSLDTARSYMSLDSIKRTLDGLAATKMNTLHWHMTDSHSFPFVSKSRPQMSKIGAYSSDKVYTPENMKEVVEYARVRGIRILMEYDGPAHVGEGWQEYGDEYLVCFNKKPWRSYCAEPPCGQLNPTKDGMYDVLSDIYKDIVDYFDLDMFHMGGDEVAVPCWESVPSITEWMDANGFVNENEDWSEVDGNPKYMKLWAHFQSNALARFDEHTDEKLPIVLWSSHFTTAANLHYLDKDRYILQAWTSAGHSQIHNMLDAGFRVIISNVHALYLDCGFGAWEGVEDHNWCYPYKTWQTVYEMRMENMIGDRKTDLIIGGAAALWSEQTDDAALDSRLWPRAAAYGERLWSDPIETFKDAVPRMLLHRDRLVSMGIEADLLQPEWCYQHEANCPVDGLWNKPDPYQA